MRCLHDRGRNGSAVVAGFVGIVVFLALRTVSNGAVDPQLWGLPITRVDIESAARIDQDGLRRLLPLEVGRPLTQDVLAESRRLLEEKRIFDAIEIDTSREEGGAAVVIRLHRVFVIDSVRVEGYDRLRRRDVARLVRVRPGAIYRREEVAAAAERIREHYAGLGFPAAKVSPVVEESQHEVDVTFAIEEGPPQIVEEVVIDGDGPWKSELEHVVDDVAGKSLTRDLRRNEAKELVRRMRQLGYYDARVTPTWEMTGASKGRLRFAIDSGPLFEIEITGNMSKKRKKLLGLMDLEDRLIITNGTWRELARRMKRAYQDSGFYRAEVDVEIERNGGERVRFAVKEGRKYGVTRLRFEGNTHVARERLLDQMVTRTRRVLPWPRSGALVEDVLAEDLARIEQLYRAEGFESAKVADVRRDIDEEKGSIQLSVIIDEGPRTMLRAMRPADVSEVVGEKVELATRIGAPLSLDEVTDDRRKIVSALARRGYTAATVEPKIDRSGSGDVIDAVLDWQIEPKTRQEIGRVIVQGNVDTRDAAILRELPFEEGDPLDVEKLLEGQGRLYKTGLFRSAGVEALGDEDDAVRDVAVRVGERPAGIFDWGVGYNTRDGFGTFAEVGYRNLGGMARHISLRGQVSLLPKDFVPDQYLARLGYQVPYVGGTRWRYTGNLLGERATRDVDKFNVERIDLLNSIDRELWPGLHGGIDADAEYADVFDVEPDAVLSSDDEGALTTFSLGPFLLYDGRDDAFNPRSGVIESMRWRYALPGISTVHFLKVNLQHSQYVSLLKKVLFLYSVRIGWARAIDGGDEQVPIRERFFLGGRTTVRGFSENTISPEGENGNETGGDLSINLNVELQVPLLYGVGGAVFVDGGGVYLQNCDRECREEKNLSEAAFSIDNFRRAAGFGLRYHTPVGPIALDYGIKLDRKPDESFGEFHFSIGSTF